MIALQHPQGRAQVSLEGPWHVIVDPCGTGARDPFGNRAARGYEFGESPRTRWSAEYDFDASPTLHVPGDWNSQREDLRWYEGTLWYQRRLDTLPPGERLFLHFGGANYHAQAWVNGMLLGEHSGGFTPFEFEITDLVTGADDFLVVRVENQRQGARVPARDFDWWNYGGLTREVLLIGTPRQHIRDWFLALARDRDEVVGEVRVDGAGAGVEVTLHLGSNAPMTALTDSDGIAHITAPSPGALWSPDTPVLHEVELRCGEDLIRDRMGFRRLARRGDEILLNGAPIQLQGISLHEEALHEPRRAHSERDARALLGAVRDLGCNFARLAHYPHNAHMARVADELGVLLWEEIPVYGAIDWDNEDTLTAARTQLRELILRDRNRASVALWSVANETPVGAARNAFLAQLVAEARELDTTRLITAALVMRPDRPHAGAPRQRTCTLDDPLAVLLDVIGCNQYLGWYYSRTEDMADTQWQASIERPLIMSEFGASARHGLRGADDVRWTEDHQAAVYRAQFDMQSRIPFLRGTSPWILKDFRNPGRPLPGVQDYFDRTGLLDEAGRRKQAWQLVHDHYAQVRARAQMHAAATARAGHEDEESDERAGEL